MPDDEQRELTVVIGNVFDSYAAMRAPLKDLCHLGGWKNANTVLLCYPSQTTRCSGLR
jgi:hypothetical protein